MELEESNKIHAARCRLRVREEIGPLRSISDKSVAGPGPGLLSFRRELEVALYGENLSLLLRPELLGAFPADFCGGGAAALSSSSAGLSKPPPRRTRRDGTSTDISTALRTGIVRAWLDRNK